jgi:hypothetical protein
MSRLGPRMSPAAAAPVSPCGCPPQDDSQRPGAGLKPTAGLGAAVGLLAGGPVGALFGAAASVLTSRKDNVAGATVRTAAKAAGAMWGVGSEAASKVEAGPVGDVLKTGLRCGAAPEPPRVSHALASCPALPRGAEYDRLVRAGKSKACSTRSGTKRERGRNEAAARSAARGRPFS